MNKRQFADLQEYLLSWDDVSPVWTFVENGGFFRNTYYTGHTMDTYAPLLSIKDLEALMRFPALNEEKQDE